MEKKKPRGRPRTGRREKVNTVLDPELLDRVQALAIEQRTSLSWMVARLIEKGLENTRG
jgi:predicted transcriptional regulator